MTFSFTLSKLISVTYSVLQSGTYFYDSVELGFFFSIEMG